MGRRKNNGGANDAPPPPDPAPAPPPDTIVEITDPRLLSRFLYPNPVCLLTTPPVHGESEGNLARGNVMTISWLAPIDNDGHFMCSINEKRHTLALLRAAMPPPRAARTDAVDAAADTAAPDDGDDALPAKATFTLSIPTKDMEQTVLRIGRSSGRAFDKRERLALDLVPPGWPAAGPATGAAPGASRDRHCGAAEGIDHATAAGGGSCILLLDGGDDGRRHVNATATVKGDDGDGDATAFVDVLGDAADGKATAAVESDAADAADAAAIDSGDADDGEAIAAIESDAAAAAAAEAPWPRTPLAVRDCIAHLECEVDEMLPRAGHAVTFARVVRAHVRASHWSGKTLAPQSSDAAPILTFLGSQTFGYVRAE